MILCTIRTMACTGSSKGDVSERNTAAVFPLSDFQGYAKVLLEGEPSVPLSPSQSLRKEATGIALNVGCRPGIFWCRVFGRRQPGGSSECDPQSARVRYPSACVPWPQEKSTSVFRCALRAGIGVVGVIRQRMHHDGCSRSMAHGVLPGMEAFLVSSCL